MSPSDFPLVGDIAIRAVLVMCARGVATAEFEAGAQADSLVITITRRVGAGECPVVLEVFGRDGVSIGGMSL